VQTAHHYERNKTFTYVCDLSKQPYFGTVAWRDKASNEYITVTKICVPRRRREKKLDDRQLLSLDVNDKSSLED
jgi:hypothetical protein